MIAKESDSILDPVALWTVLPWTVALWTVAPWTLGDSALGEGEEEGEMPRSPPLDEAPGEESLGGRGDIDIGALDGSDDGDPGSRLDLVSRFTSPPPPPLPLLDEDSTLING